MGKKQRNERKGGNPGRDVQNKKSMLPNGMGEGGGGMKLSKVLAHVQGTTLHSGIWQ